MSESSSNLASSDNSFPEDRKINTRSLNQTNETSSENTDILANYREAKVYDDHNTDLAERDYHNEERASYWLPKDKGEQHRLTAQHFAIKELIGGNFLTKVLDVVDLTNGGSVLDVGCGSGVWIMDTSADYPKCDFEGCDIADFVYKNEGKSQIKYSYGNVIEGLSYPDNSFDFVHMRLLVLALREQEWPIAIKEILRVTKPGGIIHLLELDSKINGGPAAQKITAAMGMACRARGQDPHIALQLENIVTEIGGSEIVESVYLPINLSHDTSLSKKFRWDWEEGITTVLPVLGPMIGYDTKEKQDDFYTEIKRDFRTTDVEVYVKAMAIKKL